jgi:lipoprotein-anchoring transpeptidase ErfK/SrfK
MFWGQERLQLGDVSNERSTPKKQSHLYCLPRIGVEGILGCGNIGPTGGARLSSVRTVILSGLCILTLMVVGGCAGTSISRGLDPTFARTIVAYPAHEPVGTIVIDPSSHFLYLVQRGDKAIRYGVGVGAEGFLWSGRATIDHKLEWPDWYPPAEMMARKPDLRQYMVEMRGGGLGMKGGPENPLGARAMYLYSGGKDTLYRIHGTNEPWTIGTNISSGCIRLTNDDVVDLYNRTPIGTKIVVLSTATAQAIR